MLRPRCRCGCGAAAVLPPPGRLPGTHKHASYICQRRLSAAATSTSDMLSSSSSIGSSSVAAPAEAQDGAAAEGMVCSLRCAVDDVPGSVAEEMAEVLLAYGAQSASIEEYRPPEAPEQARGSGRRAGSFRLG